MRKPFGGGVVLDGDRSGVLPRLDDNTSLRKRAARLFVEDIASAWQVAW